MSQRITEDLAGLFAGELRFDDVARVVHSTDASIYQIRPMGVAFPRSTDDVATLTQYAAENQIDLIPRGAGSGIAGGALGAGLVVDFSRHMNSILEIGNDSVRVQTGVVLAELNRELRKQGRYFAPDPANSEITTIGGMLAIDANGSHGLSVGSTRDHLTSIETVLADGTVVEAGTHKRWSTTEHPQLVEIISKLNHLVTHNQKLIQTHQPRGRFGSSGYRLNHLLQGEMLVLPQLLAGSEGTLGLFTAATLKTSPIPQNRSAALVLFQDMELAVESARHIAPLQPSACDLLDRRILSLARDASPQFAKWIPAATEAALLVEQTGLNQQLSEEWLDGTLRVIREVDPHVFTATKAHTHDEVEALWQLPKHVFALLNQLGGETRPLPFIEDIAVPPEAINEFLIRSQRIFQKHQLTASLYAHAVTGQIHFRPFMSPPTQANKDMLQSLASELYTSVFEIGGTCSAHHGNGLSRSNFLRLEFGPLYDLFKQVKEIFDPQQILNPNKIITSEEAGILSPFRATLEQANEENDLIPLQLNWQQSEFTDTVARCNGCGDCRTQNTQSRMCPFFHVEQLEDFSPRGKAILTGAIASGQATPQMFSSESGRELADSCFNCKQCQLECPSLVNIPHLAIESKAQCVSAVGLSYADYILSRAHKFGKLGCRLSPLANWGMAHPGIRWLVEKLFGISRERKLPRFARGEFIKVVQKRLQKGKKPDVIYFVDHFVNYHDHDLGHAFLQIMHHHGLNVFIPEDQVASGMAMVSVGDLGAARKLAAKNLDVLSEYAREGIPIVCTEPTAAVCLKFEYPRLLDSPDVRVVADQTWDVGAFLAELGIQNRLKSDFRPLAYELKHHTPCHLKFLGQEDALVNILKQVPGMQINRVDKGCSGMAGAFGITSRNFPQSLTMGRKLIREMQAEDYDFGLTECSSCRMQMEQSSTGGTLHPLKVLSLAYGLMPELQKQLERSRPSHRPIMT